MKILLHALGANMGGALRHLYNFIPALLERNNGNKYILILRKDIKFDYKDESLQIIRIPKSIGSNFILRTMFDNIYLPYFAIKEKADVIISLLNFGPIFCTKPHINFQRNSLYFCNYYLDNITGAEKLFTKLRSALLYLTMKNADVIVTPSDSMAGLIKSRYPSLHKKQYRITYHGLNIKEESHSNNKWERILSEETRIKLLYPTHAARHKGFEILFKSLSKLKINTDNFVLFTTIEGADWPDGFKKYKLLVKALDIENNVIFTGRIPQDEINVFYKNCDLMVYPSLCESFGFSMVEAMGYGLPIVAADTLINREICEDAALYYSSLDPEDAAQKISEGLNKSIRENLISEAKKRIESFDWSWQRDAKEFTKLVSKYG